MQSPDQDRKWIWITRSALVVYCLLAGVLILQRPGLYYDEALMVEGSVHMRHSTAELTLPHDPDTWLCARGHCFPMMSMRYIGAIKDYVCLPAFALFGPRTEVIRVVSVLFSLLCIWGIGRLLGGQVGRSAAACATLAIAINPAFLTTTVFDNGAAAVMLAAFGLVCLALSRYIRHPSIGSAFWIGTAMGFGVWARANFVWLMISILAAAVLVLGKKLLAPLGRWAAWIGGGLLGGLPFLIYQIHSNGGTWEATNMFIAREPLLDRLFVRLVLFSETLVTDREHRAMWDGPAMPGWQRWLFLAVVLVSLVVCLAISRRWGRARSLWAQGAGLTFFFLALLLFFAKTPIAEHHLIALVPLAAMVVVLACSILQTRFRWGWAVSVAVAAVYVGSAAYWQFETIQGLHRTRGVGAWSDAIFALAGQLPQKYGTQEIKILDWGLENSLYVLSDARLHTREIYGESAHAPWIDEIRRGGVFLLNGPENRQFPEPSEAFLKTLAEARPTMQRFTAAQRSGVVFADVIDIQPNTIGQGSQNLTSRSPEKLEGFYPVEPGGFRWTKPQFAVTFAGSGAARLILQLYVPDASIQKLGAITLTARLGDHALAPETFRRSGQYAFEHDVPAGWMTPGSNRFEFALDKSLAPTAQDARELGIVVVSASLEAR